MSSTLASLRRTPQPAPAKFLGWNAGCWVQYYDDTDAKDPAKALSTRSFDPVAARRKQLQCCAVCYSLQAFREARTKEGLLCFRNLGVDVDLVAAPERGVLTDAEIDRRKDEYLANCLFAFPLKPHWVVETRHGFHVVFRVQPLRRDADVREAMAVNRRLVAVLRGDEHAVLLTQILRVPGTYQFKDPRNPFLCRLVLDHSGTVAPYDFRVVRRVLDQWEADHGTGRTSRDERTSQDADTANHPRPWQDGLGGVPEGRRNATAAAIVGGILGRLPEYLWETAGWGGLKEWNRRNPVPLPERELRTVFENIARRESDKRRREGRWVSDVQVRVNVSAEKGTRCGASGDGSGSVPSGPPPLASSSAAHAEH